MDSFAVNQTLLQIPRTKTAWPARPMQQVKSLVTLLNACKAFQENSRLLSRE
jgi:hypothetical protein